MFNFVFDIYLMAVGIAVIGIAILGFIIYLNDRKNITNISFFLFSLFTIAYGVVNYLNYNLRSESLVLLFLRLTIFFAVWHAYSIFQLFYVFPNQKVEFPNWYKLYLLPIVLLTSILTLTNLVFQGLNTVEIGAVSNPERGPGIAVFGIVTVSLVISAIFVLIKKYIKSKKFERQQLAIVLVGSAITFICLLTFNFILPVLFNILSFIPLAPVFILPFIVFTAYGIIKYRLFNVKTIAAELLIFTLWIFILIRTLLSVSPQERIANTGLLFITIIVGVFLIRSVLKEVSQREKIEKLAKDLEKSNERLEEANERLKELDKLKSEFVSLATHQIRSPLTAIKGYVSLIQEGDYGPISNEVKGALDVIQQSSNNLVTIVGDFLDVSRIEQGKMKYDFTKFDVQKLTQQVVTELKPNVEKRGLVLNFSYDEDKNYMTVGDLGKLKQVIGNIIDNSIKYTPKGHIDVAVVKPTENKILIRVSDTGVGINPNVIPKLFQKFSRASNANEVNILGTGLGLYVAKQMIEAHKGRVWAESEGEGKGSKFYIELPVTDKAPIA
jgi:signal transduction histidine kinase